MVQQKIFGCKLKKSQINYDAYLREGIIVNKIFTQWPFKLFLSVYIFLHYRIQGFFSTVSWAGAERAKGFTCLLQSPNTNFGN